MSPTIVLKDLAPKLKKPNIFHPSIYEANISLIFWIYNLLHLNNATSSGRKKNKLSIFVLLHLLRLIIFLDVRWVCLTFDTNRCFHSSRRDDTDVSSTQTSASSSFEWRQTSLHNDGGPPSHVCPFLTSGCHSLSLLFVLSSSLW